MFWSESMSKEENRRVFEDTMQLCKENQKLVEAVRNSVKNQEVITKNREIPLLNRKLYKEKAKIIISKKRSFEAASAYKAMSVMVLNFAAASNPGGGVTYGARAQEESLCRCSTLYNCLNAEDCWLDFYLPHREENNPLHNDDCIYSPEIVVFKSDEIIPKILPENQWFKTNVITCAAPNLRRKYSSYSGDKDIIDISDEELKKLHLSRWERILNIALLKGDDCLILGAFGCGAFENNPQVVSQAALEVISKFIYSFKIIEFAIFSPYDEKNYQAFLKAFENKI